VCDHCGQEKPFYNSCRNRHCPQCQSLEQARWVEAQQHHLLPVPYFHVVFTVPLALHPLFLADRRRAYSLLFQAALAALHVVTHSRLGATPGTIAVLHTWSQTLLFHPHVHCIVTGGGLNNARNAWVSARPGFLVPVRVLSKVFRGKLLDLFDQSLRRGTTGIGPLLGHRLLRQAAAKDWVVYSKAPLAGPEQVLRYLGRYTHRIAIGNERILSLENGNVTFAYRDRQHGNKSRSLTLPAHSFVRRFLLHVLPRSFVRVRHFGLQANVSRTLLLARARQLLGVPVLAQPANPVPPETWQALFLRLVGRDPSICPYCRQGTLRSVHLLTGPTALTRGP
jgi:Putative transposase/Transposase zinc-binding domain